MIAGPSLLIAALGLALGIFSAFRLPRSSVVLTIVGCASGLAGALSVLISGLVWDWRPEWFALGGEAVHLQLDGLSAFFLALLSLLGGTGAIYATEYWNEKLHPVSAPVARAWWNGLLPSMGWVLLSRNALHFLIGWELFTVCAYFLITSERQRPEVRAAGWLYLAASHAGTLCLFAFFSSVAAHTGSWELHSLRDHAELAPLFWLAVAGFGVKAGVFPLHVWLPSAHANAPSHVSAILSGVAIKMGIYGLFRFSGWIPAPASAGWVIAALGVVSAVLGVAFALAQHDLKRLLAYHSVENIGIILVGLGFAIIGLQCSGASWGKLALAGGLLHVWNHGLFKALLFLGAGSVLHATGTREMSRLGGLWRAMPWTSTLFGIGAAAISGLPPLNGFISEWLVYLGLFDAATAHGAAAVGAIPAAVLLAVTGALALACFVKVCGVVFLGAPRSNAVEHAHEAGPAMRYAMLLLACVCGLIGLMPALFTSVLNNVCGAWQPAWNPVPLDAPLIALTLFNSTLLFLLLACAAALLLRVKQNGLSRAVTWDCGYARPTARMQYTAGSFAEILTSWFRWILRPVRHDDPPAGPFPAHAAFTEHTPETVLERVVEPIGVQVMRVSSAVRRLQHGRVQMYIVYLIAGVVALAVIAFASK